MAFDESIANNLREILAKRADVVEKPIVGGGLGFMVSGHLACALTPRGLTVRVGAPDKERCLQEPHVIPHMVGRRETSAFVIVEPAGISDEEDLRRWVLQGVRFVRSLPPR
jgi:hypothetical protein